MLIGVRAGNGFVIQAHFYGFFIYMKISYFKTYKSVNPDERPKDVAFYLDRIQSGTHEKIIKDLRSEVDPNKKKELKNKLPAVTFCGTFTTRKKENLKHGSGLSILDFDKVGNVVDFKNKLRSNDYVFSCWVSPSGNGVKALIKIPIIKDDSEYKLIFKQLKEIFPDLDDSGSDISRLCFESYDPDIYINLDSEKFLPSYPDKSIELVNLGTITNIPLIDNDEIANRLIKWFKSKFDSSARNSSLFKLAIGFNDFGVDKMICERYLYSFVQKDFTQNEISSLINSAYKNNANFGSKQFEDKQKRKQIENIVLSGKKNKDILDKYKEIDSEKLQNEIELIKNNIRFDEFWALDSDGEIKILPYRLKLYLENLNYYKYYPSEKTKTFIFVKKENKFIDILTEFQIKDEVLQNLILKNQIDAFDVVADKTRVFTSNYLSMIDTADVKMDKDNSDFAMIYYKNLSLKITKNSIDKIDYDDMDSFVWKSQVINREYKDVDHHESQFRSFIWFASGKNRDKYNTMKSVIGYLLHSHKTASNNKAIIFNDETISDTPNGGSGKGIIINGIGHMKKTSTIDGKTFDFNKSFAFQTVNTDTQVLAFDDVRKNFDFERLFSVITEGITIEYKGKDAIKIPVQDSPKIIISTNYTIKSDGGSFQRRIFEIEMSDYFGVHHTPLDEFGNLLYDEWSLEEWHKFDKFMINCLQYYLEKGLVKSKTNNLELRKFINETSQEFYEFCIIENNIKNELRIGKSEILNNFYEEYPDAKKFVTMRTFLKWVKKYSDYKKLNHMDGNTNGQRWFTLFENKAPIAEPENIDNIDYNQEIDFK